jgi:hypothetical protein
MERLSSRNMLASMDDVDAKSATHKPVAPTLRKEEVKLKDSAFTTLTGGVVAGILCTAGLLSLADGALEGTGGLTKVVIGGTSMLFGLVIAVIPHHD